MRLFQANTILVLGGWLASFSTAPAAPPTVQEVQPRVWQRGSNILVSVRGSGLDGKAQFLMTAPLAKVEPVNGGSDSQRQFQVQVSGDVAPGTYLLWLVTERGVSNAVPVRVTLWPVQTWGPEVANLPAALEGRLEGGSILRTRFAGAAGQRVVIDVESRRWGTNVRPVVRLLNPRGTQVAFAQGHSSLSGDARLEVVLPEQGTYTVVLHDLLYRAPAPGHFLVHIGDAATAEGVYPLALRRGTQRQVRFLGGTLDGQEALLKVAADVPVPYVPCLPPGTASSAVLEPLAVAVTDLMEVAEEELSGEPRRLPQPPCAVSGILSSAGEVDRYLLPVTPQSKLHLEVFAERRGAKLDGVLVVRRENGQELARGDDQPQSPDPSVELAVPDDVQAVVVSVEDLIHRGGSGYVYRLAIDDLSRPTVELTTDTDRVTIPAGGSALLQVNARRRSYEGVIELSCPSLPAGIRLTGNQVAPGNDRALMVLTAEANAEPKLTPVEGRLPQNQASTVFAHTPDLFRTRHHPWNGWQIAVAVGELAPLRITWQGTDQDVLKKGGTLPAKVRVERRSGVNGKVRLRLISSQPMPRKKVKENNQEMEVDDLEKALRLEKELVLDENTSEADLQIVVPADLPEHPWTLVIAADLLAADEKTVVTTAYSDARVLGF